MITRELISELLYQVQENGELLKKYTLIYEETPDNEVVTNRGRKPIREFLIELVHEGETVQNLLKDAMLTAGIENGWEDDPRLH